MKNIFLGFFMLILNNCYAQNINFGLSELSTNDYGKPIKINAGIVENKLAIIEVTAKAIIIKFYNHENLKSITTKVILRTKSKEVQKDAIPFEFGHQETFFMNNKIIMLFNVYELSTKQNLLFAQRISSNGKFEGDLTIIDKIPGNSRSNAGSFLECISEDSTKFLIIQNLPYNKKVDEKFNFKIYDSNLKNISNFGATLSHKDKDVTVSDYYLGNDGTVYLLASIQKEKNEEQKGEASYYNSIYAFKNDGTNSEFEIKLNNKQIESIALRLDEKNKKILCSGMYSEITKGHTGNRVDGIFFLKINMEKKEIEKSGFQTIDKTILASLLNIEEKTIEKKSGAAYNSKFFKITDILSYENGNTKIVSEFRTIEIKTSHQKDNSYTLYYYIRKNIFVLNLDSEYNITSFVDIPKRQYTVNDEGIFSSFALIEKGENLIFIYTDNAENLTKTNIQDINVMKLPQIGMVVAAETREDGTYTKQKVYSVPEKKIQMQFERAIKIGKSIILVPTSQPKNNTCGCIDYFSKSKSGIAKIELK